MTSRTVISSVPNFVNLIQRNPGLASMPAFASIVQIMKQAANNGDKKCSPCKAKKILNSNRQVFESAITHLQEHEKNQMKTILQTKEVCYYTVNAGGKLDITCF